MALIKDITDIRKFISVNEGMDFDNLTAYIDFVERDYIIDIISQTQYDALNGAYAADPGVALTTINSNLLIRCQEVVVNLALLNFVEPGSLQISDVISVVNTEQSGVLSQSRKNDLKTEWRNKGFNAVEKLLKFLWNSGNTYPLWNVSDEKIKHRSLLINTAEDFSKGYYIRNGFFAFSLLKNAIERAEELFISAAISEAYYIELKDQVKNNTLSVNNTKVINQLKKAIPPLAIYLGVIELGISIDDLGVNMTSLAANDNIYKQKPLSEGNWGHTLRTALQSGEIFLAKLRIFLNKNASVSTYPLYFSSACYISEEDRNDDQLKLNNEDSGFFIV